MPKAKRTSKYPTPEQTGEQSWRTTHDGVTMDYHVVMRRRPWGAYPVVIGRVNGETRMECDFSTTWKFHRDRFWDTVHAAAYARLSEIAVEYRDA